MPVSPQYRDLVLDLLAPLGEIDTRRMFGGLSIRCEGQHFGVIIQDQFHLVCNAPLRAELTERGGTIFSYRRGSRAVDVPRFVSVPEEMLEDMDEFLPFARRALLVARDG